MLSTCDDSRQSAFTMGGDQEVVNFTHARVPTHARTHTCAHARTTHTGCVQEDQGGISLPRRCSSLFAFFILPYSLCVCVCVCVCSRALAQTATFTTYQPSLHPSPNPTFVPQAIQPISDQCGDYHSTPATVANHEMGRLTGLPITKSRHTAPG